MLRVSLKFGLGSLIGLSLCQAATLLSAAPSENEGYEFFEKKIRPALVEHCYQCHSASAEKVKGGLLLDTREGVLKGGESGKPLIQRGDAERSRLIEAIRYTDEDLQMPPKKAGGKLSDAQIADFVAWVDMGAPDPRTGKSKNPKSGLKSFWAFQRPAEPLVPSVKNRSWPRTTIDRFILAKLEEKGMQPSPPADKRALIRRASYDLTGLPPTPEAVDAFLEDESPEAF